MRPVISVVMPVLNGDKYLRLAIESILNQTFKDFEFIIINDGSTDSTEDVVQAFSDPRVVCIKNEVNLGLSKSFNIGIRAAQGEYIARMDADDIALPTRFEKQLEFLKAHPHIGIVGSSILLIDEAGKVRKRHRMPTEHLDIKWKSLFSTPLLHPTVMGKAAIFKNNPYDESLTNSEDYELWSRLLFEKSVRFANLPEALLKYRVFKKSFTQSLSPEKRINSYKNRLRNIERYIILTEAERSNLTFKVYRKAAKEFAKKEGFKPSLWPFIISQVKHSLKQLLR